MEFSYGNSRFVILTNSHAIKLARIRPIKALTWFVMLIFGKIKRSKEQKGKSLFHILGGISLCGIMANRREYAYSVEFPHDPRIKLVSHSFLFGFVIVQPRGMRAKKEDIPKGSEKLFPYRIPRTDTRLSKQYAIFLEGGIRKTLLIDFGNRNTINALARTL